jgi:hypothetical protein
MESHVKRQRSLVDGLTDWTTIFDEERPHLGNSSSLKGIVVEVFKKGGFSVSSPQKLEKCIKDIEMGYIETPYHNFSHATHVFLNSFLLLNSARIEFTEVERAAMLYSAIIHDYGHEGVTNMQLVKENHHLSQKYKKVSPAENYSIDAGLELLDNEELNFFGDFSLEEMVRFKDLVKQIVLATDIGNRDRVQKIYGDVKAAVETYRGDRDDEGDDELKVDDKKEENRVLMLCLIMKISDVGAQFQHGRTSKHWIRNFYLENQAAYNSGRGPAIIADSFSEDQKKFFTLYISHLLDVMASSGLLAKSLVDTLRGNLEKLKEGWEKWSAAALREWAEEAKELRVN